MKENKRKGREDGSLGLFWWHAVALLSLLIGAASLLVYQFDDTAARDPWYIEAISDVIDRIVSPDSVKPAEKTDTSETENRNQGTETDEGITVDAYYYQYLDESEKQHYDSVCKALSQFSPSVEFADPLSLESLDRVMTAAIYDHPEYYWLSEYVYYQNSNHEVTSVEFKLNGDEAEMLQKIYSAADTIIAGMPDSTDYEKYKYIYQYITDNTVYDASADVDHQQVGSVLFDHVSVCAGYAKTYQLLSNRAGLYCTYVSGTVPYSDVYGDRHAWNLIMIDGKYYWSDVTWGDPVSENNAENRQTLYYFCDSDQVFLRDHFPAEKIGSSGSLTVTYPECTDNSYEYCRQLNSCFDTYDFSLVKEAVMQQVQEGRPWIEIQFGNDDELGKAIKELFDENGIHTILSEAGVSYSSLNYLVYDTIGVLAIELV